LLGLGRKRKRKRKREERERERDLQYLCNWQRHHFQLEVGQNPKLAHSLFPLQLILPRSAMPVPGYPTISQVRKGEEVRKKVRK
jgi:hypothetical protein